MSQSSNYPDGALWLQSAVADRQGPCVAVSYMGDVAVWKPKTPAPHIGQHSELIMLPIGTIPGTVVVGGKR
jgi:hypothetical protein